MRTLQLGKDKTTGQIVDVSEVSSGLDCNCSCVNCGDDLLAVKGDQRRWYFRHRERTDCEIGQEEALQALAIQLFKINSYFYVPKYGRQSYDEVVTKDDISDYQIEPDVVLFTRDYPIYIRFKLYEDQQVGGLLGFEEAEERVVEIDLSSKTYTDKIDFERFLLDNIGYKRVWTWHEDRSNQLRQFVTAKETRPWILGALGAGLAFGLYYLLRSDGED